DREHGPRTVKSESDGEGGRSRPQSHVVALGLMLRGVLARFLRHLFGAFGSILGHSLLLLVHPLGLHRAVTHGLAGRFLAAAHQLVPESHLRLLRREQGVSKIEGENATNGCIDSLQLWLPSNDLGEESPHSCAAAACSGTAATRRQAETGPGSRYSAAAS